MMARSSNLLLLDNFSKTPSFQSAPFLSSAIFKAKPRCHKPTATAFCPCANAFFRFPGRNSIFFLRSLAYASSSNDSGTKPCLAAIRTALSSDLVVPRACTAFRTCLSKSALLFASCSNFSTNTSALGNSVFFASSCAEASQPVHARLSLSTISLSLSASASKVPSSIPSACVISTASVRSAARAKLISSTSARTSFDNSRPRMPFASSAAFCTRMNRPAAFNSAMSSASRRATNNSISTRVHCQRSGNSLSMRSEARLISSSGAPASLALMSALLISAPATTSASTNLVRSLTVLS
mmetsp:Transcript_1381/g.3236  ORF Transcript_1381/g.3236 Transcript_1381/m.3236 type:complete len:297 (+) Transcript_1381:2250-3140(+)